MNTTQTCGEKEAADPRRRLPVTVCIYSYWVDIQLLFHLKIDVLPIVNSAFLLTSLRLPEQPSRLPVDVAVAEQRGQAQPGRYLQDGEILEPVSTTGAIAVDAEGRVAAAHQDLQVAADVTAV
jgi:hypothetical protein